ncbi:fhkA [Symbiodinium pilosum]|uniref:FhkA protein n=1 Tax=Symbiodinium pilosum TaxID=2952 RepID=A0A812VWL0_SYMPI|nr:fhkA [Symbiodinium pilosum]
MAQDAYVQGSWGRGPDFPHGPARANLMVEPMQTVFTKKVNWEVRSRAGAPQAIERWAASVPSRRVPFATLGHRVTGEFALPSLQAETRSHLVRAASAPQLDLSLIMRERRQAHTRQRAEQALHVYKISSLSASAEGCAEP